MFKDRFKEARKNAGLSQEKMGLLLGVSKQTISDYERGYSEPDMAKITMVMQVLNVDANFLWQDEMNASAKHQEISSEAMQLAYTYDQLNDHSKLLVRTVVDLESRRPAEGKMVPVIQGSHDNTVYAQYYAKEEQQEMAKSEISE